MQEEKIVEALRKTYAKIEEVEKVAESVEELLIGMGTVLEEIKKYTEGGKADEDTPSSKEA